MLRENKGNLKAGASVTKKGTKAKRKNGWLIPVIILFVLLSSSVLIFILDIGGLRSRALPVLEAFGLPVEGQISQEDLQQKLQLEAERQKLAQDMEAVARKAEELEELEHELLKKEGLLNEAEKELKEKEDELEEMKAHLSLQINEIREIVQIYEKMDGENAAKVLAELVDEDEELAVRIFKNLKKDKAGEILAYLDPKKGAGIIQRLGETQEYQNREGR
ncbi:MAG: MotE family protein [Clostridia bacterium]|jgi:flagellar motility protein MotE (MotC chaperone)